LLNEAREAIQDYASQAHRSSDEERIEYAGDRQVRFPALAKAGCREAAGRFVKRREASDLCLNEPPRRRFFI